jgi:phosphoribosyl 1,2-cyclic phosphodiesterase
MNSILKFCSLSSGSCGNVAFISFGKTKLLIDAGLSVKMTAEALSSIGEDISSLDALLLTHEHIDHSKSIRALARRFHLPVYASHGTWKSINNNNGCNQVCFNAGKEFIIGDIRIESFSIFHDAAEPVGFTLICDDIKVSIITDTGCISENILQQLKGSHTVLLEANHDEKMLEQGSYPYYLKKRILSDKGHLSNVIAGKTAAWLVGKGTKRIILGHISSENNSKELARDTVNHELQSEGMYEGKDFELEITERLKPGRLYGEWQT